MLPVVLQPPGVELPLGLDAGEADLLVGLDLGETDLLVGLDLGERLLHFGLGRLLLQGLHLPLTLLLLGLPDAPLRGDREIEGVDRVVHSTQDLVHPLRGVLHAELVAADGEMLLDVRGHGLEDAGDALGILDPRGEVAVLVLLYVPALRVQGLGFRKPLLHELLDLLQNLCVDRDVRPVALVNAGHHGLAALDGVVLLCRERRRVGLRRVAGL